MVSLRPGCDLCSIFRGRHQPARGQHMACALARRPSQKSGFDIRHDRDHHHWPIIDPGDEAELMRQSVSLTVKKGQISQQIALLAKINYAVR